MYSCITHGWSSHDKMCPLCSSSMIHTVSSTKVEIAPFTKLVGLPKKSRKKKTPFIKKFIKLLCEIDKTDYCECGCKGCKEHSYQGKARFFGEFNDFSEQELKELAEYFRK